jgi:hypothetical protein
MDRARCKGKELILLRLDAARQVRNRSRLFGQAARREDAGLFVKEAVRAL